MKDLQILTAIKNNPNRFPAKVVEGYLRVAQAEVDSLIPGEVRDKYQSLIDEIRAR